MCPCTTVHSVLDIDGSLIEKVDRFEAVMVFFETSIVSATVRVS